MNQLSDLIYIWFAFKPVQAKNYINRNLKKPQFPEFFGDIFLRGHILENFYKTTVIICMTKIMLYNTDHSSGWKHNTYIMYYWEPCEE